VLSPRATMSGQGEAAGNAYSVSSGGGEEPQQPDQQLLPGRLPALPAARSIGVNNDAMRTVDQQYRRVLKKSQAGSMMHSLYEQQTFSSGRRLKDLMDAGHREHLGEVGPRSSQTSCCGCQPLNPESNKRLVWDILLVFLLLYVACIVPMRIAFDSSVVLGSPVFWFEVVMDLFFLSDIVLNFRTSVLATGDFGSVRRIDDKRTIAKAYMSGWFALDFIAVLPYSYVELMFNDTDTKSGSTQQVFKALRLVRLAKLLRLTKMLPLLRRLDDKFEGLLSTSKLLSTMFVVVYITHLVGCAWYAVGSTDEVLPGNQTITGWVSGQEWDRKVPTGTRWLRSFYWAMTTLTTVGFGDISPSTTEEMIFGALAELFGTIVFGTLVGTVGSIIGNKRKLEERHEGEIAEIKEFMRAKHLPPQLQHKVRKYLGVLFKQTRAFDEKAVMKKLPPNLSFELMDHLYGERIKKVPLFRSLPEDVVFEMCGMLLPYPADPGDYIFKKGVPAREIFIMNRGDVILTTACDSKEGVYHEENIRELEDEIIAADENASLYSVGAVFGEEALDFEDLVEVTRKVNAIAVDHVNMSMLRVNMVEQLAKKYPIVEVEIKKFQRQRAERHASRAEAQATKAAGTTAAGGAAGSSTAGAANADRSGVQRQIMVEPSASISEVLQDRAEHSGYASAGGPALEVRTRGVWRVWCGAVCERASTTSSHYSDPTCL
jgi:hypothetical protein